MSDIALIREAIRRGAGMDGKNFTTIIQATVNSVNQSEYTCNCTPVNDDDTNDYTNVNLSANNNDGFIPIPAIDSLVLIAVSTRNDDNSPPYLVGWDLLQGMIVVVQNDDDSICQLLIQNGKIQLNDGTLGGLVEVINLTTKLNNLENAFNDFVTKYNSHTHAGVQTGPGTTAVPIPTETTVLTPTVRGDIENDKIIQGL